MGFAAHASDSIKVVLNGEEIDFNDQQPITIDGRTLVPVRAVFDAFGMEVSWDEATETVIAIKEGKTIQLTIDSETAFVDDEPLNLDVPAIIENERTLVPLRFISESLNMEVEWDEETETVIINEPIFETTAPLTDEPFSEIATPPTGELLPELYGVEYYFPGTNCVMTKDELCHCMRLTSLWIQLEFIGFMTETYIREIIKCPVKNLTLNALT